MTTTAANPINSFLFLDNVPVCLDFSFPRRIDFWLSSLRDIRLNPPEAVLPPFQYTISQLAGAVNTPLLSIWYCPFSSLTYAQSEARNVG